MGLIEPSSLPDFEVAKDGFLVTRIHNAAIADRAFAQLPDDIKADILNYEISTHVFPPSTGDDVVLLVFARLKTPNHFALDVDLLYESMFLTAVALFEVMLEDILVEAVCGPRGTRRGSFPLVTARSRDRFRTVLRQGRAYNDFMPFNRAIDLATYYVNGAMPFSAVTASDRTLLSEISWTRNAIAHRSEAASKRFRESVPGVASLLRNRQRPGPFLRFQFRANPNQTRSDLYLGALGRISSEIALAW